MDKLRQPSLDILRGMAAFWVFLFHVKEGGHIEKTLVAVDSRFLNAFFATGHSAVAMFFVLSGFVIAQAAGDAGTKTGALRFLLRRAWRICPAYYASIVVALAYIAIKTALTGKTTAWPGVHEIAMHLLFLQDLTGVKALNAVYWTLCIEVQFYLSFVVLMIIVNRLTRSLRSERAHAVIFGAASIAALVGPLGVRHHGILLASLVPTVHLFLLGILLCFAANKKQWAVAQYGIYALTLTAIALITNNAFTFIGVMTSLMIVASLRWERTFPSHKLHALSFFGLISYGFYLFHNNATGASFNLVKRYAGDGLAGEMIGLMCSVALCTAIAAACYFVIERPSMRLGKALILRRMNRSTGYQSAPSAHGSKVFPD